MAVVTQRQTDGRTDRQIYLEPPELSLHGLPGVDDRFPVHHDGGGVEVCAVHVEGCGDRHCSTEKRRSHDTVTQSVLTGRYSVQNAVWSFRR